jgi:FKBP-type peptidyl-prolyl cis-trans isomerase FkpA
MRQDKIIGGVLAVSFVLALGGIGFFIWKAQSKQTPSNKTTVQKKAAQSNTGGSGLAVVNNNGIGGGIAAEGQAQALGSNTQQKQQSQQKTINFTEYEKYKDAKSALFGEITPGTGAEAVANKELSIGYKVWLTNGQLIDQTGTQQFTFVMGEKKVIPGLEQGIYGMKVGGKRLIIVPPAVAYGEQGKEGIPPNSVLVFEVELIDLR